jgi:hypothetical protein
MGRRHHKRSKTLKSVLIALVVAGAVASAVAPAQGQQPTNPGQACPPGQSGNNPYCQVPPPNCGKSTAKMSISRASLLPNRTMSILAPITSLASGRASVLLQAAGTRSTFTAPIDSGNARIRVTRAIKAAQARLRTGILTITYRGDADTRKQVVRLRAANNPSRLIVTRPTISNGRLRASGRVSRKARGVVRVQLEYVKRADGETVTIQRNAKISNGRWRLNSPLSSTIRAQIARRCGTVHSYTLFTGYQPQLLRGEMRSYEVLPSI